MPCGIHPASNGRTGTRRVDCPSMAEDCELESHTREGASRFPSGAGAPARLVFHVGGERAQSKPMPLPAPSVFKTAPVTRRFTLLVGRHDRTRTCILRLRRAALIQLSYVTSQFSISLSQ